MNEVSTAKIGSGKSVLPGFKTPMSRKEFIYWHPIIGAILCAAFEKAGSFEGRNSQRSNRQGGGKDIKQIARLG